MSNLDRLRAKYSDLSEQESKLAAKRTPLFNELNQAVEKVTAAKSAVDKARTPAEKTKAQDALRDATRAADNVQDRLKTLVTKELPQVTQQAHEAGIALHEAEARAGATTTNIVRPGGFVAVQGDRITNTTITVNGRTIRRD